MNTIKITCEGCGKVHEVRRTNEIPDNVISMGCNWCPDCSAKEDYMEWYNFINDEDSDDDVPDNQLCFPFIIDEILERYERPELCH